MILVSFGFMGLSTLHASPSLWLTNIDIEAVLVLLVASKTEIRGMVGADQQQHPTCHETTVIRCNAFNAVLSTLCFAGPERCYAPTHSCAEKNLRLPHHPHNTIYTSSSTKVLNTFLVVASFLFCLFLSWLSKDIANMWGYPVLYFFGCFNILMAKCLVDTSLANWNDPDVWRIFLGQSRKNAKLKIQHFKPAKKYLPKECENQVVVGF